MQGRNSMLITATIRSRDDIYPAEVILSAVRWYLRYPYFDAPGVLADGRQAGAPDGPFGQGVSICLFCQDTLSIYHDLTSRGVSATRPFVGNGLWVTSMTDPDGYRLDFESLTDVLEETVYSE